MIELRLWIHKCLSWRSEKMLIFEVGKLLILPVAVLTLLYLGYEPGSDSSSEECDDSATDSEGPR